MYFAVCTKLPSADVIISVLSGLTVRNQRLELSITCTVSEMKYEGLVLACGAYLNVMYFCVTKRLDRFQPQAFRTSPHSLLHALPTDYHS